jgi:Domain of unknown function (DUF4349)
MRRLDEFPIDPDVAASLDAIDAALAGEPVDPDHADVAALALLITAERPRMGATAAQSLDERIRGRFGGGGKRARRRAWPMMVGSIAAAAAAALAIVLVALSSPNTPAVRTTSIPAAAAKAPSSAAASTAAASASVGSSASGTARALPTPLTAPATGRRVVQSAQLQLSTAANRIDQVAQEAFDVVGSVHGYVNNSTVTQTGGSDGYANLELTVPASLLAQTMTQLSRLADAQVSARTDGIQDVTNQYSAAQRRVADAQAHRTALLKQLANAQTTEQVNSLNAQIRDADAAISAAQNALASLTRRINNVQIGVTISAAAPVPVAHSSSFTIGKAAHDARRVLVVAAGVALIVLAVLVPVALLAALLWWAGAIARRRRREHALGTA